MYLRYMCRICGVEMIVEGVGSIEKDLPEELFFSVGESLE